MTVKRIQSKIQKQIESYIHVKVHTTYNYKNFHLRSKIVSCDISWLEVKRIWHIWHIKKKSQEYTTRKKSKEGALKAHVNKPDIICRYGILNDITYKYRLAC